MYLIFDTETTGLPRSYNAPMSDLDNWPRLVQLAWQLHDDRGRLLSNKNFIIRPEGFTIPYNAEKVHGISTKRALEEGHPLHEILQVFREDVAQTKYLVGHNIGFDIHVVGSEFLRAALVMPFEGKSELDTKDISTNFCALPGGKGGKFKWPTLTELHQKLFGVGFEDAHDAAYDVDATARCFFGLINQKIQPTEPGITWEEVQYEPPALGEANFVQPKQKPAPIPKGLEGKTEPTTTVDLGDTPFTHLHVHTQFSVLQATSEIPTLIAKAKSLGMKALAMTDHGNMMGAFHFVKEAMSKDITPILGGEFNLCRDRKNKTA
ncbi:MAG: PHP domain-containing protein, partial [Bacteroidetes bacterium]|nr:PHP domain-containing protein [Bacteroidota bacterium]